MRVAACLPWLASVPSPALCHLRQDQSALTGPVIVIEVRVVTLTLQQHDASMLQRQHQEKRRLVQRLRSSKWSSTPNHARHRLLDALHNFSRYRQTQTAELARLRDLYRTNMPEAHKALLERHVSFSSRFDQLQDKLRHNQALCDDMVQHALGFYTVSAAELDQHMRDAELRGWRADRVSVSQALKHIVRDWTAEGGQERRAPFDCTLRTLDTLFPDRRTVAAKPEILLPGAGLGRLAHDLHDLQGFRVTVNEWSMFVNVVYRFLQHRGMRHSESLHPFVDAWSHQASDSNQQRQLSFPDVSINPRSVLMMEGDFTTAFRHTPYFYDAVVTHFFIDTARNLLAYLDAIQAALKPGGYWVNLGPLLYGTGPFVQLPLRDIVTVAEAMGFEFVETSSDCGPLTFANSTLRTVEAAYGFDQEALTSNTYKAQFWVARKKSP